MTKSYEKLLSNCQRSVLRVREWNPSLNTIFVDVSLSELLYLPMPDLPSASHKSESIMIGSNTGKGLGEDGELFLSTAGGKWEDEEERRFFEDIQDLRDYVPRSMLGLEEGEDGSSPGEEEKKTDEDLIVDMKKLDEELAGLENKVANGITEEGNTDGDASDNEDK